VSPIYYPTWDNHWEIPQYLTLCSVLYGLSNYIGMIILDLGVGLPGPSETDEFTSLIDALTLMEKSIFNTHEG